MTGDENHAKIYANECAEIRKMYLTAKSVQLALEKVILRLETVEQFGEALIQLAPIMEVVKATKKEIVGLVPEVAGELERVTSILDDVSREAGQVRQSDLDVNVTGEEARRILEASRRIADEKTRERFPELPFPDLETASSLSSSRKVERGSPLLLEQVLSYIESHNGRVSVSKCANALSTTPGDVMKAIDQLREEGRLAVEWEKE
ncbi:hypothetical protein KEJ39_02125 [Candidatus Bathyarchaeota archaeon]|nr:hypothetical protein [Candidatus Bathyarchaeota archaeon]